MAFYLETPMEQMKKSALSWRRGDSRREGQQAIPKKEKKNRAKIVTSVTLLFISRAFLVLLSGS